LVCQVKTAFSKSEDQYNLFSSFFYGIGESLPAESATSYFREYQASELEGTWPLAVPATFQKSIVPTWSSQAQTAY
jgi:hypothetical protein